MGPRRVLFCLAALCWLVTGPVFAQEQVLGLRLGVHPDKTRIVLDLSGELPYSLFSLADPYRVVIDMPAVEWATGTGSAGAGGGLVAGYRFGLFRHDNSRVVLDLTQPAEVSKTFFLPAAAGKSVRLVIDLVPVDRAKFMAGAGFKGRMRVGDTMSGSSKGKAELPPPVIRSERITIVVDAGHGGVDPGAISRSGHYEKNIVLDVARRVQRHLVQSGRYRVVMTRETDVFVPLRERVNIARNAGADLFVSVHADSLRSAKVRGASVYSLSEKASDKEAAQLAAKENSSDVIAGISIGTETDDIVRSILIDLAQRETKNKSVRFAKLLLPELGGVGALLRNSHRYAGFRVLTAPDVPSVLVELGLLSNAADEKLLMSAGGRDKLAAAIFRAIDQYFADRQS
jgi:N-acetylmuramoyl-L-alanine amidase